MKVLFKEHNSNSMVLNNNNCKAFINRASDNSRGKKSNFAGFLETNSQRKQPISQEFSRQISPKNKEESQEERFQKKKIYWKDVKFKARKKTQVHPTQFSRQLYLFRATRKT